MKATGSNVNLPKMEEDVLAYWSEQKTFYKSNDLRKGQKEFAFYDGPPFANGLPHYGHLLANTIKDTVPRYWNMRGYYVERRFGWDTHGVPVEYEVEKNLNLKGRQDILDLGIDKFNELCRESVLYYAEEWQKTITRLGRWVDWDNQYRTMDLNFMESVWNVFKTLYDKDLVYQSHKVVPYSPRITAILSNFEANQNYQDVQDPAITVKFKLMDEDAYVLAWTTTPWTLISNLALAIGPDIEYVKVKATETGEIYYLAKARLEAVFKRKKGEPEGYQLLEELPAAKLAGRHYAPLFRYFQHHKNAFKILVDEFVTTTDGTGIVHMAPAYGEDDFRVCNANGIDFVDPLDEEARYKAIIPEFAGVFVKDADKDIIKALKDNHQLLRHETLVHSYPMCDRTGGPLIYRTIPSWFVAVEKFKDNLVENNETINWVPGHLKQGRMGNWLRSARDWAISRNRFWGTPLPIYICEKDENHRVCLGSSKELEDLTGTKITDLHIHKIDHLRFACPTCKGTMKRVTEVFDCWFESGSMPYAQLHYPFENKKRFEEIFPADFIAEGQDQTRGWFYTLAVLSSALFQKAAFKNVVVNGLILATDGKKMSKRWKNYTPPIELISEYGADSVRLYMLNSAVLRGEDLKFSNDGVKDTTRAVILPLWNAYSFLSTYAEADGWKPAEALVLGQAPAVKGELDRWIISRLHTLMKDVHVEMEGYHLYNVVPRVIGFIEDLTNWYIRLSRRRFWAGEKTMSEDTTSAYQTLYYVLVEFSKLFAPLAPFTAERIYQGLTEGMATATNKVPESVHLSDMPMPVEKLIDAGLERRMDLVRNVTELGRSLRSKHQIKTRQVLAGMQVIVRSQTDLEHLEKAQDLLKSELNLKEVSFSTDEASHVNLSVKPNLKLLGKRLGKDLNAFKTVLDALNTAPQKVAQLINQLESGVKVEIMGHSFDLEDFLVERGPKDDKLIATAQGATVLLDTHLTESLIMEGLAREFVNRIQNFRKDSGLQVSDKITIQIEGGADLQKVVTTFKDYIAGETLGESLDNVAAISSTFAAEFEVGEEKLRIGISKV
ncbi:MAG: isoleucine--tRNA ligase [Chitinophagaceae bacterium]|nr:isoleucine--tRNA ligase [Oligoflexus sp.]